MSDISGPKLLKRRVMKRRDVQGLRDKAGPFIADNTRQIESAFLEDGTEVNLIGGVIQLARNEERLFPTLRNPSVENLPSVFVDMGAVPYVCKGADVMSPGIVKVEGDFGVGELVVVRDITHSKSLSVCSALVASDEMQGMERGKALRNLHYVGDKLWQAGT